MKLGLVVLVLLSSLLVEKAEAEIEGYCDKAKENEFDAKYNECEEMAALKFLNQSAEENSFGPESCQLLELKVVTIELMVK